MDRTSSVTACWASCLTAVSAAQGSTKPHMVDLLGHYANPVRHQIREITLILALTQVESPVGNTTLHEATSCPKRVRRLRDEQVAALVAAYQAGDSTYDLARRYGIRRETVTRHLERAGVPRREAATARSDAARRRRADHLRASSPLGAPSRDT
jgi:hypothetical protein